MNLKNKLFEITKEILRCPARNEIKNALLKLKSAAGEISDGNIEYAAQQQHAQFGGYLAVDDNREKINSASPFQIPPLSKGVREVIERSHAEVVGFNDSCLSKIGFHFEKFRDSVDPYSKFNIHLTQSEPSLGLISKNTLAGIPEIFAKTTAALALLEHQAQIDSIKSKTDPQVENAALKIAVHQFKQKILQAGPLQAPNDFLELARLRNATPTALLNNYILDLVSISSILEVADQLIYQAAVNDELLVINEENIINVGADSRHALGRGIEIECQPNSNLFFNAVSSIVLLDFTLIDTKYHDICRVEAETISFSKDQGNSVKLKLRFINDELNPYFGLYPCT